MHTKNAFLLFTSMLLLALTACNNEPRDNEPRVYTSVAGAWACEEISRNGTRRFIVEIENHGNTVGDIFVSNFYNVENEGIVFGKDRKSVV